MEEANLEPGTADATAETNTSEENQQEVTYVNGQGWRFKNYHPNLNKEGEQPPLEDVLDDEQDAEQPTVIEPVAVTTQDQPVPTRVYTPKVPYPVHAKRSRKDCEEMKCKKMLEELNVKLSLMDTI
ncbi:hypothetical protein F2Q69_00023948 [Brassica cretica]|uniref:Uncharacterized protein n=1 Tax=Brassica cretica TaxID=69181 RepID=A0A8S9Q046_BRACR|nr:hypothetical protein F2Q69_00023948 [Brassica cretica]